MEALAVGALFGVAAAWAGRGVARWIDRDDEPVALGACTALAAVIVLSADVASYAGFTPWWSLAIWAVFAGISAVDLPGGPWHVSRPRLLIVGFAALFAALPLLVLPVPLDTDGQGFGHLALAIRDGGTIDTLAPWRPGIAYLYAPGALIVFATFSWLTGAPMHAVMMGVSHAAAVLVVWLAWELGGEIERHTGGPSADGTGTTWPRAVGASACFSVGLWTALLDSHATSVVALPLIVAFVVATMRYCRTGSVRDLLTGIVALAAVPVTHSDSAVIVGLAVVAFVLLSRLGRGAPSTGRWIVAAAVPPVAALVLAAPWLVSLAPLLDSGIRSPYGVSLAHLRGLVLFHGIVWTGLSIAGILLWRRQRWWWLMVTAGWLALIVESSLAGWIEAALPWPLSFLLRFNYPYSVAWHGPIVPYMISGAAALVWIARRRGLATLPVPGARTLLATATIGMAAVVASPAVLALTRPLIHVYGAFSSHDDVRAMEWIRDHTPPDARVLNYPGDYDNQLDWEAHWAPVITERDCVYFRMQPFFLDAGPAGVAAGSAAGGALAAAYAEQRRLLGFWRDPADPTHAGRLRDARIDYVLAPAWIADPASLERDWRWQPPQRLAGVASTPDRAPYLRLVYASGGARVYTMIASERGKAGIPLSAR